MTRNAVRSAAVALLLVLTVFAAAPAHAAAPATPGPANTGDVLQQIWSWVTSIFGGGEEGMEADHRCTIDPNGCPYSGATIENDHRCTIDPNGGMVCGE